MNYILNRYSMITCCGAKRPLAFGDAQCYTSRPSIDAVLRVSDIMFRPTIKLQTIKSQIGRLLPRNLVPLALIIGLLPGLLACGGPSNSEKLAAVPGAERPFPHLNTVPPRPRKYLSRAGIAAMEKDMQKERQKAKATATDAALRARTQNIKLEKD
jgi:hypothetical protein